MPRILPMSMGGWTSDNNGPTKRPNTNLGSTAYGIQRRVERDSAGARHRAHMAAAEEQHMHYSRSRAQCGIGRMGASRLISKKAHRRNLEDSTSDITVVFYRSPWSVEKSNDNYKRRQPAPELYPPRTQDLAHQRRENVRRGSSRSIKRPWYAKHRPRKFAHFTSAPICATSRHPPLHVALPFNIYIGLLREQVPASRNEWYWARVLTSQRYGLLLAKELVTTSAQPCAFLQRVCDGRTLRVSAH